MRSGNIGNKSRVRPDQFCKKGYFSGMAGPHFKQSGLCFSVHFQKTERHAYVVVEIPFCCRHPETCSKYGMDQFFGSGFPVRSCQSYHGNVESVAMGYGKLLQSSQNIRHPDQPGVIYGTVIYNGIRSPLAESFEGKTISVKAFPLKCKKKTSPADLPGICANKGVF